MSGDKCVYINCKNTRRNSSCTFHPFPSNLEVSKKWIVNSGNIMLEALSPKKLKRRFICSIHFNKNDYSDPSSKKSRLNPNVVPNKYSDTYNPKETISVIRSPKTWVWKTTEQDIFKDAQIPINEMINTTPTKSQRQTIVEDPNMYVHETINTTPKKFQRNTIVKENVSSSTPEKLKVLTPDYTYSRFHLKTPPKFPIFNLSPESFTTSPTTTSWVSQLIDLPSPQKLSVRSNNKIINSPSKIEAKNNILQKKLQNMKKLLKQKRAIITSLKKANEKNKHKKINVHRFFEEVKFPSPNSKALMSMQLLHKKRKSWSTSEQKIALSLYYKSPSTYKYMRTNGIILPAESTVRRWLNSINFSTGFPQKYMEQIKLKISNMNIQETKCAILLDEISIMKTIEYNKVLDEIEGFEDLGILGRTNKLGSHALVVMVRGIYAKWKIPLCYFFTGSGVKGINLITIIEGRHSKLYYCHFSYYSGNMIFYCRLISSHRKEANFVKNSEK